MDTDDSDNVVWSDAQVARAKAMDAALADALNELDLTKRELAKAEAEVQALTTQQGLLERALAQLVKDIAR